MIFLAMTGRFCHSGTYNVQQKRKERLSHEPVNTSSKKLLPDLLLVMQKRFEILQYIRLTEPIGRRSLSASLGISERVLRGEVQFLKEQNLVDIKTNGMTLTEEGYELLSVLEDTMKDVLGLTLLEKTLKERLNLKDAIIVSGDSDQSPWVKKEMGRAAVACMKKDFQAKISSL